MGHKLHKLPIVPPLSCYLRACLFPEDQICTSTRTTSRWYIVTPLFFV